MTELEDALTAHVGRFNAAVRSGDWTEFTTTFDDDAVMMFVDAPTGPYVGREAIAEAYRAQPPDGTMTITSIEVDPPDTASAVYRWESGDAGTMTIRWVDGKVAELTVAVDESARANL